MTRSAAGLLSALALVGCAARSADPNAAFVGLADAYAARNAAAAAEKYTAGATVVYAYDGAAEERYTGRKEIEASFASFFDRIAADQPLDLNFRVAERKGRSARGFYRLRLGQSETSYGRFDVDQDAEGLFSTDRSSSANQSDFEELPGPLLVRPDQSELDRSYYGLLTGRYRLPDGCRLVVTRSTVRLFVRNTCNQSWRGLHRVSGLHWTGGQSVLPSSVVSNYHFAPVDGAPSASVRVVTNGIEMEAERDTPYTTQDVSFTSADGTHLTGTLYLPEDRTSFPSATVMVHGSGPQDRDGYASIIAVLADALAAEGRAVLAYDKRGSGTARGNGDGASFDVLAEDAVAAVRYLRGRAEIEPNRVGLAGSSQAGWVVAKAIAQGAKPADVLLLGAAGAAFTVREQNLYNTEVRMECAGIPEAARKTALLQQEAFFDALADRSKTSRLDALTREASENPQIRNWLFPGSVGLDEEDAWFTVLDPTFDPQPIWKDYSGGALFLFSEFDDSTDTTAAVERLRDFGTGVKVLPGAQHLGLDATSLCDGELADRRSFSPQLFAELTAFAKLEH